MTMSDLATIRELVCSCHQDDCPRQVVVDRVAEERDAMLKELGDLTWFKTEIEAAHQEHLRTGDYAKLGIATQDTLQKLYQLEET